MTRDEIETSAKVLDNARIRVQETQPLKVLFPELSLEDAYLIQECGVKLRLARGEEIVGYKMGLTSKAKMEQMGLHSPVTGVLTNAMRALNSLSLQGSIHPKAEPEIAFVLSEDLRGEVSPEEAWAKCAGACTAIEVLDSRFKGFKYFSLEDVVADNSSASRFVLGPVVAVKDMRSLDWTNLSVTLQVNGENVESGNSAAVLGNPLHSLAMLAALFDKQGKSIPRGSIILTGAITPAVALKSGTLVEAHVEGLGKAEVRIDD